MSKIAGAVALCCQLCAIALGGCANSNSDENPSAAAGSGGISAGSGGAVIASGGAGGAVSNAAGMGAAGMSGGGEPTFTRVWTEVLSRKSCNGAFCHGMGQANLSMLNKNDAYANLVDVPAAGPKCGASGMLRVKRGDPTQSLFLDKISNAMPACGDSMPIATRFAPECLSDAPQVCNTQQEITLVRDWIAAGAKND